MKIKIFHDWEGKYFAFPDEAETALVRRSIGMEPGMTQVMTRRDNNGAVTHTRQDLPERWCTTYPSNHPNIPNPTHWGQGQKRSTKETKIMKKIMECSNGKVLVIDGMRELSHVLEYLGATKDLTIDILNDGVHHFTSPELWCKTYPVDSPEAPELTN